MEYLATKYKGTLTREGRYGGSQFFGSIDNLTYTYDGNQLKSVNDIDDTEEPGIKFQINGFSDYGTFATTEFTYDPNGTKLQKTTRMDYVATHIFAGIEDSTAARFKISDQKQKMKNT